jgi:glycosyltransferase involved in cell wall biosynthesis
MRYNFLDTSIPKTVTVITPTIGSSKVKDAIRSVKTQTYDHIKHLIVVDGDQYDEKFVENFEIEELETIMPYTISPENTGANGFYGHRIYAAYPHLVNSDYIFFLDEDNWYEPNHVETLVATLNEGNEFAYSLRQIYDEQKNYLCDDNCESLGKWPIFFNENEYLVDTSSFAFKREFLIQVSQLWHSGWGGDRRFYNLIREKVKHDTSGKHTLCYRLDGNPNSVSPDFFVEGNAKQLSKYNGRYPWQKI